MFVGSSRVCLFALLLLAAFSLFAEEPSIERITLLRPSEDAEVLRDFLVVTTSDGRQRVMTAPQQANAASAPVDQAYTWSVDLKKGTYTTKLSPLTAADKAQSARMRGEEAKGAKRFRASSQCEEYATSDDWIPCDDGERTPGWRYAISHETWQPTYFGYSGATRTEAEIEWKSCDGDLRLDFFDGNCYTTDFTNWRYATCGEGRPYPTGLMQGTVIGNYENYSLWDPAKPTFISEQVEFDAGYGSAWGWSSFIVYGEMAGLFTGRQFESGPYSYQAYCGGTGSGGSGDGGGGSLVDYAEKKCVPVYEGQTGAYLGDCCGTTNTQIINCAKQYLS